MIRDRDQPQFRNRHRPIVATAVSTIMATEAPWLMNHSGVFGWYAGIAEPPAITPRSPFGSVVRTWTTSTTIRPIPSSATTMTPSGRTGAPVSEIGGGTSSIAAG